MKKSFFSILLLAAMAFSTQAALYFNEPFTYANGALTTVSAGLWAHYSGAANQLDVLSSRAHLTQIEDEDVQRSISPFLGGTIYYSFVLNVSTAPPSTNTGNFIVFLKDQATLAAPNLRAKVFITPIGAGAGRYRVGVANGPTTIAATSAIIPTDLVPGTAYVLVVCYSQPLAGGIPHTILWINPCSPNDTVNRADAIDQTASVALDAVALSQSIGIGVLDIDNLKVATTFPEVGGDTNAPTITCPANITVAATSAAGAVVTFAPTVTDDTDPTPTVSCQPPSGSTFPIGSTTVVCNARDDCGNVSRCVFLVTVLQQPPLQIACPADITAGATTAAGRAVSYPPPVVTGGCPPYTVVCNPPSGSVFPIGSTSVNCIVSDTCNHSIECVFKVTVVRRVIEVDTMPFGLAQLTLAKGNATEVVTLAGPTTVNVYFDGEKEGDATDDDGNGRDEVQSEMVAMDLRGTSSMGPVQVVLDPTQHSLGQIEETANATPGTLDIPPFTAGGSADSFFDVFVEIRVGAGATAMVLHPARPLHMQGVIKHKPPGPGDTYVNPFTDPVPLLDANGNDTGIRIVREVHTPNPEQERDSFTYTQGKINLRNPNGQIERVIVAGPTEVLVNIPPNGAAADIDGNGLEEVPMEMTSLNLAGNSSLGPVMVMLDPARCRSYGKIEEKVNNTPGTLDLPPFTAAGGANSSFDLCLKIVVGGRVFRPCNNVLVHIASMISHKPPGPGEAYMNLIDQEIPLCDENGVPTGYVLTGEMHTPNIPKEIDFFPNTVALLTVQLPNGGTEVVTLTGPTRVEVSINDADGLAADTDGDGLDQVPTLMTMLNLAGNSSIGPVQVSLRADRPSLGEIEETANNTPGVLDVPPFAATGTANSFFDIWPVITVGGQNYTTAAPLHMAAVIRHKPPAPGDEYVNPFTQPVELLDAAGNHTGIFIIREVHTPNPDCTVRITCPPDMKVGAIVAAGVVVNYPAPVVIGTCPPITVVCNPPSGSVFPIGTTTVTCVATDRLGNRANCSFRVTVFRRFVEVDKMPYGTAQLSLLMPNGGTEVVSLAGPTTVNVYFDGENEGDAMDDDGDGRDEVDSEMTGMDLRGNSSMGVVQVTLDPNRRSVGMIEETSNTQPGRLDVPPFAAAGTADSFFDVFPEIRVAGRVFRPAKPLHMAGTIRHKPPGPGDTYVNPFTEPVDLLDENGSPTGIKVVREVHTPNPEKEIDVMTYGTAQLSLTLPNGLTEVVTLAGPTTVAVDIAPNGGAADTDGDGLEQVPTEMIFLHLTGNSSMGPVVVTLDPARPTLGEIEETANNTPGILDVPPFTAAGTASSFFDVFAIVQVGAQTFHTATPLRMQSIIRHKPPAPGDTYVNPFLQPVELLDANGRPTGIRVVREVHTPNPEKEIDVMNYGLAQFTLRLPNGATENVTLAGPTTVEVAIAPSGAAADTDGDGREQVPTQMTSMDLRGNSSFGPVQMVLDPTRPTLGEIEETANATPGTLDVPPFTAGGTADSFFDVFVEIRVGNSVFRPASSLHMSSVIRHKPPAPGDTYVNPFTQPVELLDANGGHTGIFIIREVHTPNPEQERDSFTYTQGKINLRNPNGQIERVIVAGPTEVLVNIPPNGAAADIDGNGLEEVPMEMTSLNLAGNSSLGPVMVMLDPARCRSYGKIEEKVNNTPGTLDLPPFTATGGANSSFDLCLKIVVGGRVFRPCNNVLVHIASMISHKPPGPGEAYMNLIDQEIPLCDENGVPTGYVLTGEMHTPNIPKEIDFFPNTVALLTVRSPNGAEEVVTLTGPTRVEVSIDDTPGPGFGLAADTDGDGLEQVPTEMTLLNLAGVSSIGPVQVSLRADRPSTGEIEETANLIPGTLEVPPFAPGTANSFFDIWPNITVGGQTFHTAAPLHMAAVIRHKPPAPGDEYVNPFLQPVPLLDANGNPTGFFVVREVHTPNPPCTVRISCPSNIVVWTCSPNGQVVNYPPPTATSSCTPPLTISCVPPSGSNFPPGNTPVTCTAKDSLGNSASCTFTVGVTLDTTPPRIVCPGDIKVETCLEREQVFYAVTATDDCDTNVTIVCNPPSGSSFPPGTTPVLCRAADDCGHSSECRFLVTVTRLPDASLTIRRLSDGRLVMCWSAPCDDYVLQCTRSLNTPILWETIPGPYPGTAAQHCVTNSPNAGHQFYRLKKRGPNEVFEPAGTLPPQGAYMSPSDEISVVLSTPTAGGPPRRVLARWFVHPIPVPPIVPRPPPCLTCPPDLFEFHSKLDFQLSMDEGQTWAEVSLITDVAALVGFNPQPEPPGLPGVWPTEILRLDATPAGPAGGFGAAALPTLRLRESPTLPSKGKTTIRQLEDGTFRVGSFFDIFVEASLDGGQTWMPLQTPVHMELSPRAPTVPEALDSFPPAGTYDSPSGQVTRYASGLLVRRIVHPNPTDLPLPFPPKPNPPCLTCPPASYRFTTDVQFDLSTDGGQTWMPAGGTADEVVRARLGRQVGGARFFDTEMLALNIHGGGVGVLPNLVMIRESPSRPSKGMTSIRESPSLSRPEIVESFFDIFTELSTDGGQTWSPSTEATHVELNPQPLPPGQ